MKDEKNKLCLRVCVIVAAICLLSILSSLANAGTTETSGITAATIISRAEVYLDAADDPFYTDANFIQWIDEAVRETVNRTSCLEAAPITIELVADTYRYDPDQSFLRIVAIQHDNGDTSDDQQILSLDRIMTNDTAHSDATGRPRFFSVWNDQIEIWPIPRAAQAETNLYVYTVSLPTGVSATNSAIETPAYLDVAILYYVVGMAWQKNGISDREAAFMQLYEKRVAEYNALILQRKPIE